MEEDLLQAVIKVEKEIQQNIEAERRKAAEWLESVRDALNQELDLKKQELTEHYNQSLEITCRETRTEAENEIQAVNRLADYLQHLPADVLEDVVAEYLHEILPKNDGVMK